jgi:hypothetical protein
VIHIVGSADSAILKPFTVSEYGWNRFMVGAARIAVETRRIAEIVVSDPKFGKRDAVHDPVLEPVFFALFT